MRKLLLRDENDIHQIGSMLSMLGAKHLKSMHPYLSDEQR